MLPTAIRILLPSRPLFAYRNPGVPLSSHRALACALSRHADINTTSSRPLEACTMLGKAATRYQASAPPASKAQSGKSDLSKQLFPSSSPRDGNIVDLVSSGHSRGAAGANLGSSKASGQSQLQPRSSNSMSRTNTGSSVTSFIKPSDGFATLYSKADSFKEEPVTTSQQTGSFRGGATDLVYIAEDDFSDDDDLELDYACPSALPTLPPPPKPTKQIPESPVSAPPTSQATIPIPWTSSPEAHRFPPQATNQPPPKRQSPVTLATEQPIRKKRQLPKHWSQTATKEDPIDLDAVAEKESTGLATPAKPKEKPMMWDTTQSAIKDKRAQLKNKTKNLPGSTRAFSTEGSVAPDDVRAAVDSHAVKKNAAVSLSLEQRHVIDLVINQNQSVFFTGPAGTGKSVLMRAIIDQLKKKWARDPERVSVTASTGLAACNIGGQTLHSFAGIGLGKEDVPTLVKKIRRNQKAKNRWLRTKTLIVDEVSMVDGDLFDKLAQIARTIRNNGRPWGGIQLVITGDFFQLPPVPDKQKRDVKFAFEAATWTTSIDHTIGLTQVFRQRDPEFANMLNEMRLGRISEQTVQTFKHLARPLTFDDGLDVTELFPTRQEVDRSNDQRLRNLPGSTQRFDATDTGHPDIKDRLLENMMAPKAIELRKGAQVMLIKNLDETLVNGSLGKVKGFMCEATFEIWSGENAGSDDEEDPEGRAKKKIKAFSRDPDSTKDLKEYPVVQFTCVDGSHRTLLMLPEDWKVELPNGEIQAQRRQVPLILAWALSIHKAQGQTLERVKVDLGKVFEKGQAYVALSRATSKQGLQVLRFDKNRVMAHPRVIQFYNKLYSAESAMKKKPTPSLADFASRGRSETKGRKIIDIDDDEEAMAASYG
ncbi:DNA helicase-like protein [Apiospora rasikravindrae]|uniref:ATP-dependent DNA helicase PIF1 n=1 Tax=Apiospora rasikravindrae TaxID=990691 RepID=A0ABR1RWV5_9PEZI